MSNTGLFYAQIVSTVVFIIALFVLYRLLVEQKEATIQLLKEKIDWLHKQLDTAKENSPDVLMERLNDRVKVLTDEIERLSKDKVANEAVIKEKSEKLVEVEKIKGVMDDYINNLNGYIEILRWTANNP
jgi:SMC interacting uncharacterized protein involved in chromosome segregation